MPKPCVLKKIFLTCFRTEEKGILPISVSEKTTSFWLRATFFLTGSKYTILASPLPEAGAFAVEQQGVLCVYSAMSSG